MNTCFRLAVLEDLPELLQLEEQCFTTDRLNSRSFQWMITRAHGQLLVAQAGEHWLGYAVVLFIGARRWHAVYATNIKRRNAPGA